MSKKVVIIEDEPAIAQLYEMKFTAEGYDVKTATNGKIGLELAEKFLPDIILLDLMMPEMTGVEMLGLLRKTEWGKNIKVIILTNVNRQDAPSSVEKLGVRKYIIKAEYTASQVAEIVKAELGS